jgi:hypothetical protein
MPACLTLIIPTSLSFQHLRGISESISLVNSGEKLGRTSHHIATDAADRDA